MWKTCTSSHTTHWKFTSCLLQCVTPKYFDKFEPNKILTKLYVLETFETLTLLRPKWHYISMSLVLPPSRIWHSQYNVQTFLMDIDFSFLFILSFLLWYVVGIMLCFKLCILRIKHKFFKGLHFTQPLVWLLHIVIRLPNFF